MDRQTFYKSFTEFLRESRPDQDFTELTPSTHLWDAAYLDSFMMVQVIVFLEELAGREIKLAADALPSFYTLEIMYETYLEPRAQGAA